MRSSRPRNEDFSGEEGEREGSDDNEDPDSQNYDEDDDDEYNSDDDSQADDSAAFFSPLGFGRNPPRVRCQQCLGGPQPAASGKSKQDQSLLFNRFLSPTE